MSKTISAPIRINKRGGVATETSNIWTLIALGVLPTGEMSAWDRRDGLTVPSYVWESDGPQVEAAVRDHVEQEFARLEAQGRARLVSVTRTAATPYGESVFTVSWVDLETGKADSAVLPSATGG